MHSFGSHLPKRLLVTCLAIALLVSGATVPHSHAVPIAEHDRVPHLHAHALLDWFAVHHEHDADHEHEHDLDHEHEHDLDHSQDQERIAEQSGVVTVHSMSSTTTSDHDDDALYVVADRMVAERDQTTDHFQPILFAFIADAGRVLQRNQLRLCRDPPPPILIVPIYVRMLSLRI